MIISILKNGSIKESRLYKAVKHFIETVASNRCKKYFVGGIAATQRTANDGTVTDATQTEFEKRLENVVRTLMALRATFSSTITVGEESYLTQEYHVPQKLISFLNSGRVYMTGDAIGRSNAAEAEKVKDGDILTPLAFNAFWDEFNRNQDEGNRIVLTDGYTRENLTLGNLQFADDGNGLLVKINDSGLSAEECWLFNIKLNDSDGFTKYPSISLDGMAQFLKN
jgi:hypothetical protein